MEEESLSDAETRADMAEDRVHELEQHIERLESRLAGLPPGVGASASSSNSSSPVSSTSEEGGNGASPDSAALVQLQRELVAARRASEEKVEAVRNELAEANLTNSKSLGEVAQLKKQVAAAEARADDMENRLNEETFG